MPVSAQDRVDLVDEVGLDELAGRQVDRHEQPRPAGPGIAPAGRLAAGRLEHPASERDDQPGLLGQRDERERRDQTADGVLPADERLEPDDPVAGEVHQRLVEDAQLATLDRAAQVVLHVDPVHRLVGHRRFEQGVAVRWIALGPDHRDLGLAEHLARRRPPGPPEGDPERRADEPFPAAHRERGPQLVADPLGDPARVVRIEDRVQDDPEFVAAETGDRVARAERADQALADRGQQAIADRVPDALVDDLEPIEVEQDHRDDRAIGRRRRQRLGDPVGEQLAVRQPGRRVVERAPLGGIEQARVVERDRGELCEPDEGVRLARPERAIDRARGEPDDADRLAARRQRHAHHRAERPARHIGRASGEVVVVGDRERCPGPEDLPGKALVDRHPLADEVDEDAAAVADHQARLVGLGEIDVAMRGPEQRRGVGQDRLEQDRRVVSVEEREGGLVERAQVRVGRRQPGDRGPALRLGQVERAVGHVDEGVLGPAVVRVAGDPDADRHARPTRLPRQLGHAAADPDRDLVGDDPVGAREDDHELVAAVAIDAVVLAGRFRDRARDSAEEGVAGRVAAGVVERLEPVEVEHQDRERPAQSAGLDRLAELALERAVVAQPGQRVEIGPDPDGAVRLGVLQGDRRLRREQLGQLELVGAERRLVVAHPADVERADRLAVDEQRDDDHRLGLERGAGHLDRARIEMGAVGQDGLAVVDHPAGDPGPERDLVGEDHLGEGVAGDDRPAGAGRPVDAVDGQRVVRDDRLERIGDQVEDAGRLERREESLVDLEQAALAVELELELGLLVAQPFHVRPVDQRLGRVPGEDLEGRLVVVVEPVAPVLRQDDDAVDGPVEGHRDDEHRLRPVGRAHDQRPAVGRGVAEPDRLSVRRHPAGQPRPDRDPEERPGPGLRRP